MNDIGFAIEWLKRGALLRRRNWPVSSYVSLARGATIVMRIGSITATPEVWLPSMEDVLAENWSIIFAAV